MEAEAKAPKWIHHLNELQTAELTRLKKMLNDDSVLRDKIVWTLMRHHDAKTVEIKPNAAWDSIALYKNGRSDTNLWTMNYNLSQETVLKALHHQLKNIWGLPITSTGEVNMDVFRRSLAGKTTDEELGSDEEEI